MQITFNNVNKTFLYTGFKSKTDKNVTKPEGPMLYNVNFMAKPVLQGTVSSRVANEKSKLLKHIKDLLAMDIPIISAEEKAFIMSERAHNLIKMKRKKKEEIISEINILENSTALPLRQKIERFQQLRKELIKINKLKPDNVKESRTSNENYDYVLLNRLKNAILDDDFNLAKVLKDYYVEIENISTVDELKNKFPKIKVPQNPKDIVAKKIVDNLTRGFYLKFDELIKEKNLEELANIMAVHFEEIFVGMVPLLGFKNSNEVYELIGERVTEKSVERYKELSKLGTISSVPEIRKNIIPNFSDIDMQMLKIDYDKFILTVLKKHYLNDEKLNSIEYLENDNKIKVVLLKAPEYKFEKFSEKIKKIISDAEKIKLIQRDYQNYTVDELKSRLNYYATTGLGNNERILETIIDFNESKFTQEDKQYLIKFLKTLDDIIDGKITEIDAVNFIEQNNISPRGTVKLNEIERRQVEEKLRQEKQKANELNSYRQEFNSAVGKLYEYDLCNIADDLSKFYPMSLEKESIAAAKKVINFVNECLAQKEPAKIRNYVLRKVTYDEYFELEKNSEVFLAAQNYAKIYENKEQKSGQYLINREIIDNYPESKEIFAYPEILEKIMERCASNPDAATRYLCKYEDYKTMNKAEQSSIINILENFDVKNQEEKLILKSIIEDEFILSDSVFKKGKNSHNFDVIIASEAKQQIYDKYKFPTCLDLFKAFEEAVSLKAGDYGSSGVKRTGTNNNALEYKMEIKIKGYPDRLFSSKNDYRFDVYSERGLH